MRRARILLCVLATLLPAVAQGPPKVSAEEAKQHLMTAPEAVYPPLAKAAHIMGKVRLEVEIDETGVPTRVAVLSGHPMLVTSALNASHQYRYRPFEVGGKPSKVQTEVEITFPAKYEQKEVDRENEFQKTYWPNFREGDAAYRRGDFATARDRLLKARAAAEAMSPDKWIELSETMTLLGHIAMQKKEYDTAEELYKECLALREKRQKPDEAEVAGALGNLALLYVQTGQSARAKPLFTRAATIYEARFATASEYIREAKNAYGRSLAIYSFYLGAIAMHDRDTTEARSQCGRAEKYVQYASEDERAAIVQRCTRFKEAQ